MHLHPLLTLKGEFDDSGSRDVSPPVLPQVVDPSGARMLAVKGV